MPRRVEAVKYKRDGDNKLQHARYQFQYIYQASRKTHHLRDFQHDNFLEL
jgi:hypothetical protein